MSPASPIRAETDQEDDLIQTDFVEEDFICQLRNTVEVAARAQEYLQEADDNFTAYFRRMADLTEDLELMYPYDERDRYQVAMCITTYKRTQQLLLALPANLCMAWAYRNRIMWVVADLNDTQEERDLLKSELLRLCPASCAHGHLRVFEPRPESAPHWNGWHASVAKNASHLAALSVLGENCVVCNVDGDNVVTTEFLQHILRCAPDMIAGGESSGAASSSTVSSSLPKISGVSYKNPKAPSTTGRIACGGATFKKLGGYREDFLPMGYQDVDFTKRLGKHGTHLSVSTGVGNAILNVMEWVEKKHRRAKELQAKVANVDKDKYSIPWGEMNEANMKKSKESLAKWDLVANRQAKMIGLPLREVPLR